MRLFQAVLSHVGQVYGQGAGAHPGARAQQQDTAPRTVRAPAVRLRVQQPQHDVLDFLRRDRGVDKIADARSKRGDGTFRLAQEAYRDTRQRGCDARQQTRQFGGLEQLSRLVFAEREIQEHHLGRYFGQAARQFLIARRLLGQHPHVAQHLPQLHRDIRAFGAEQKPLAVLQAYPLACMCLHIVHREKPGICWPPMGPVR
ncbi:hypothetical protein D3C71_1522980 [compost metagenome]